MLRSGCLRLTIGGHLSPPHENPLPRRPMITSRHEIGRVGVNSAESEGEEVCNKHDGHVSNGKTGVNRRLERQIWYHGGEVRCGAVRERQHVTYVAAYGDRNVLKGRAKGDDNWVQHQGVGDVVEEFLRWISVNGDRGSAKRYSPPATRLSVSTHLISMKNKRRDIGLWYLLKLQKRISPVC